MFLYNMLEYIKHFAFYHKERTWLWPSCIHTAERNMIVECHIASLFLPSLLLINMQLCARVNIFHRLVGLFAWTQIFIRAYRCVCKHCITPWCVYKKGIQLARYELVFFFYFIKCFSFTHLLLLKLFARISLKVNSSDAGTGIWKDSLSYMFKLNALNRNMFNVIY